MSKKPELSVNSKRAYEMLKDNGPLTVAQMKELGFAEVNSANLIALKRRGLVESVEVVLEGPTVVKRKVQLYTAKETEQYMT